MSPCQKRPSIWLVFWVLTALAACQTDRDHDLVYQYRDQLPKGFPVPEIPADNEPTPARITLGRALFYDVSLSADSTKSCASCHQQAFAFADNVALSEGIKGRKAMRNSPSLANVAYQKNCCEKVVWQHSKCRCWCRYRSTTNLISIYFLLPKDCSPMPIM